VAPAGGLEDLGKAMLDFEDSITVLGVGAAESLLISFVRGQMALTKPAC
jgi:hypothetical protein